jgi:very-short-patch-repair endonuclease
LGRATPGGNRAGPRHADPRGAAVHRTSQLAPPDVTRQDGIPLTSPARTLLDLASLLDERPLRRAVRQAQSLQRVNAALILDGRRVVPDFRWPEQRLVIEADGAAWHDSELAREDDADRQALLEAHGERVLRVTWDQAIARPRQTLSRIRAAGAPRNPRPTLNRP